MIFNTRPWLIDTLENKREIQRFETVQKVNKIIFASKCELKFRWLIEILADHEWYIPADVSLYSDPYDEFSSLTFNFLPSNTSYLLVKWTWICFARKKSTPSKV